MNFINFMKKFCDKIKEPKPIYAFLFTLLFLIVVAGTICLVVLVPEHTIWHYLLYPISALVLAYFVYIVIYYTPKIKSKIVQLLKKYPFTNKMLENYGYRTIIISIISFILNVAYLAFLFVISIMSSSIWYLTIAIYYLVLSFMKGIVFYSKKKYPSETAQLKTHRFCGYMFIALTVALSGIIVLIYTSNMTFEYAGLMIYVVATFTFYKLTLAIFNMFKARKQSDILIQTIRNINLASALVSIIVLQVELFQAFSPESNLGFANGLTGAGISIIILLIGILMIINSNKKLNSTSKNMLD